MLLDEVSELGPGSDDPARFEVAKRSFIMGKLRLKNQIYVDFPRCQSAPSFTCAPWRAHALRVVARAELAR